jgi:glutamate transport system permease protein
VVGAGPFKEKGNLDAAKWTPFLTADIWVNYLIPGLLNTLKAAALPRSCWPARSAWPSAWVGSRMSAHALGEHGHRRVLPLCPRAGDDGRAFGVFAFNNVFRSDLNPLAAVVTG